MPTYKAVKLDYSSEAETASSGILPGGGKRGIDLSPVNELAEDGWELFDISHDEDGCWQEAILVKHDA